MLQYRPPLAGQRAAAQKKKRILPSGDDAPTAAK
jgi:hypothetical protein